MRQLLLLLFILISTYSRATHIVGGVINYRYLGNNEYEFKLYVYRDCKYGIALFDNPLLMQVSRGDNTRYAEFGFQLLVKSDTLSAFVEDPCVTIQPDVCVEYVTYTDTLILPPLAAGYIISYSRCCRNNSILNIVRGSSGVGNDIDWGATYTIHIPGGDSSITNSSPVFKNFPPVGICASKPIVFDHSATDADGDSLVYHLCTPFDGALKCNPTNYSSNPNCAESGYRYEQPPYKKVVWQSPYSETNMLGGIPLKIDSITGLLTGTPNTVGQFVVGICVDEYRKGVFLTRTIRDFQFNVTDCGLQTISSFFAPEILCDNFTVNFTNRSIGALTYKWYFGDGDSSSTENPTHLYKDTGTFNVILICNQGGVCENKYAQKVTIQIKEINADFIILNNTCYKQGDTIQFLDKSNDSVFIVAHWKWNFSTGDSSILQNPYLIYNGIDSTLTANLIATSSNKCIATANKQLKIYKKATYSLPDSLSVCSSDKVILPLNIQGNVLINWTPSNNLNNHSIANPTLLQNTNQTYYLSIKNILPNGDTCIQNDSIKIIVSQTPKIELSSAKIFCSDNVSAFAFVDFYTSVEWYEDKNLSHLIGTNLTLQTTQPLGEKWYYFKAINLSCSKVDSILLTNNGIHYKKQDTSICGTNDITLDLAIQTPSQQYNITWYLNSDTIKKINNSIINLIAPSSQTIYYSIINRDSCTISDSLKIKVNSFPLVDIQSDKNNIYPGEKIQLSTINFNGYHFNWEPSNLFLNNTIYNPITYPIQNTLFKVVVTDSNNCKNTDTLTIYVEDYNCNNTMVFIPNAFSPNGDGINDVFIPRSTILKSMHLEIYDRWGNLVFTSDDIAKGWDGTYKNKAVQPDIYAYYFVGECLLGQKIILKGNVTLLK